MYLSLNHHAEIQEILTSESEARLTTLFNPKSGVGEASTAEASRVSEDMKYFMVQKVQRRERLSNQ